MDRPEHLDPGETVWRRLRGHWTVLTKPAAWLLLTLVVLVIGLVVMPSTAAAFVFLAIVVLAMFVPLTLWPFLNWRNKRFVFTSARVILLAGVARRRRRDILLVQINDVKSTQSMLDRLFGCGTLTIQFSDRLVDRVVLRTIPHVTDVHHGVVRHSFEANEQKRTRDDQLRSALTKLADEPDRERPADGPDGPAKPEAAG
jgi:uncharacterized membrane protein YdbT with pleckstrin-like domain